MTDLSSSSLNGRLHLHHGPIDLIIEVQATSEQVKRDAYQAAVSRFSPILSELVSELLILKSPVTNISPVPSGIIAFRMYEAVKAHSCHSYITPMAAVAGAVADEVLHEMAENFNLSKAYVNNGGDIAIHLSEGESYEVALASLENEIIGHISMESNTTIRGLATSGRGGRSLTMGIAESVTVLANSAASADAAATLIANAVDIPGHPNIRRTPACEIDDNTDLGDLPVVTHCPELAQEEVEYSLKQGADLARRLCDQHYIVASILNLQGHVIVVGNTDNYMHLNKSPHCIKRALSDFSSSVII